MPILNYTSKVDHQKSINEIQFILSKKGATKIMVDYDKGIATSISFQIPHAGSFISFRLPANVRGVQKALKAQKGVAKSYQTEEHAVRVCWRIIKDWIEAQMAIVEAEQADIATIFLPYATTQNGSTVASVMLGEQGKEILLIQ